MSADFDPRQAALNHAGEAAGAVCHENTSGGWESWGEAFGEFASAVACGLVYVGDKIDALRFQLGQDAAARDQVDRTVDAEVISANEDRFQTALQAIRDYEEDFGSGPADDDMRAIAIRALEGEPMSAPVKLSKVAEPDEMPTADARLLEARGDHAQFSLGGSVWQVQIGEVFRLVADTSGRFRVATESQLEREAWRAFLRDQAAQIPDGVKAAARELTARVEESNGLWMLDGFIVRDETCDALVSLADWVNQLNNIEREVSDGSAGD